MSGPRSWRPWRRFWLRISLFCAALAGLMLAWIGFERWQPANDQTLPAASGTSWVREDGRECEEPADEPPPTPFAPVAFRPLPLLVVAAVALVGMGVFLVFAPRAAAGGWLVAVVFWSGIPIGSLVAIMIHALVGGRWGHRFASAFIPAAAAIPLIAVLLIPVLVQLPGFYPWASGSGGVQPDVARYYLNSPFFIGRTLIALAGWSLLGLVLPRLSGTLAVLVAAVGLAFYGFIIGITGFDWILSLEPLFVSTSFGATLAFIQLASAFAWALLALPGNQDDSAVGDLGGLLLATLLGTTYINFMAVLVIWYGDLPHQVIWFVKRDFWPWTLIGGLTFVFGSVIPIFALFLGKIRSDRRTLRLVSGITLAGIALYFSYTIAPSFGVLALGAALLSLIAIGALLAALIAMPWSRAGLQRGRTVHAK